LINESENAFLIQSFAKGTYCILILKVTQLKKLSFLGKKKTIFQIDRKLLINKIISEKRICS